MVFSIIADGLFAAAVLLETLAAVSLAVAACNLSLREEADAILVFYRDHLRPMIAFPADLVASAGGWFGDAYAISAVLFFLFFIAQAKRATAVQEGPEEPVFDHDRRSLVEAVADAGVPIVFCVLGAILLGLTLLPLLTPPLAAGRLVMKAFGKRPRFEISRSYYVNLLLVASLTGIILALPR